MELMQIHITFSDEIERPNYVNALTTSELCIQHDSHFHRR